VSASKTAFGYIEDNTPEQAACFDTRTTVAGFFSGDGPFFTIGCVKRGLSVSNRGIEASTGWKDWVVAQ